MQDIPRDELVQYPHSFAGNHRARQQVHLLPSATLAIDVNGPLGDFNDVLTMQFIKDLPFFLLEAAAREQGETFLLPKLNSNPVCRDDLT